MAIPVVQPGWSRRWSRFKREMPHQRGQYAKRNWGHPLHSLCSYQGKMKPALAHFLVECFVPPGGAMLDPFGGVGTIPFEAALTGRRSWSFDISPAALSISRAKVARANGQECARLVAQLERLFATARPTQDELASAASIRFNGSIPEYFHPRTLAEILLARRYFAENPPADPSASLVFASILHILHGNRPYALSRRSHPITPFAPTGETEYRPMLPRLREKVSKSLSVIYPSEFAEGVVLDQDATKEWPDEVRALDAIVTSPPFFDSTRFYLANWMRLWFAGWESPDFKLRPGEYVDELQKKSFDVYEPVLRQGAQRLSENGVFVMHLGKSKKCDMAAKLRSVAERWYQVEDLFVESVEHCESHGISDKGSVASHQYLVLRPR